MDKRFDQKLLNRTQLQIYESFFKKQKETIPHKILCIDGGGIRGIFPAFMLYLIEQETKKPISHLFNTVSGTSTGAIITTALSIPRIQNNIISTYYPQYSANEVIDIFVKERENIFVQNKFFKYYAKYKYDDNGRKKVFHKYIGDLQVKDCLINNIITAVSENNQEKPFSFNKFDSQSRNTVLVDALMATSAAPTFFKSYEIANLGKFVDGGVSLNNPSMYAYQQVLKQQYKNEDIFMLSLGTGQINPKLHQKFKNHKLHWGFNFHEVSITQQVENTDYQIQSILQKNYVRWQVQIEQNISLDSICSESIEYLKNISNEYFEEIKNDDSWGKVIETLLEN